MASGTTQAPPEEPPGSSNKDESARFECNICLDAARDAVVSLCGHLFCWPCLSQWLDTRPNNQVCPVCKSAIDGTKVVPIYGRGGDTTDPRTKIPPRPKGQRSEPQQSSFGGFNWGGFNDGGGMMGGGVGHNVHFSFGIGIFPLSFVASWFNNGNPGQENGVGGGAPGNQGQPGQPGAQERGPGPYGRVHSETAAPGSRMAQEEEYLSNIFKYIGIFMLLWLFLV